jgi:hypothetical protein
VPPRFGVARLGVSGAVAASAGGAPNGVPLAGGVRGGSTLGFAAFAAGEETTGGEAPKPSIVRLKSGCRDTVGGGSAEAGGKVSGGAGSPGVAADGVAAGAAVDGGGVGTAACIIVRLRDGGAEVSAPHSPQNWAFSGSEWPHWVQVRVFIKPVRLGVAV